ncbi:MAG TPA: YraN family protein [Acidimicrobiales bacterium]|nr:YraN family protein [Acidimicrobiales bacterium]
MSRANDAGLLRDEPCPLDVRAVTGRRRALGARGEEMAADWYLARGYEVLARNWRCREGEIDLIVRQQRTIVFCEVKTRSSTSFGHPAEAVTHAKRTRLRHLAAKWLDESPVRPLRIRFDVAAVLDGEIEVLEGCF